MLYRLLLQIGLFLSMAAVMAQPWSVHMYDAERHLPSEITKDIAKDTLGFVWVASDEGLARFDGVEFKTFRKEISSVFTKKLLKLTDGNMLLATDFGIDLISSYADTTIITPYVKGGAYESDTTIAYPKDIYEATDGSLWIAELRHIVRYKNGNLKRYFLSENDVSTSFIKSFGFKEDDAGRLWASSYPGNLFYYSEAKDEFIKVKLDRDIENITELMYLGENNWLLGSYSGLFHIEVANDLSRATAKQWGDIRWIKSMCRTSDGMFYIGTRTNGLYRCNWMGMMLGNCTFEEVKGLEQMSINAIYANDKRGSYWVASDKGIALVEKRLFQSLELEDKKSNIHAIAYWKKKHTIVAEGRTVYLLKYQNTAWKEEVLWEYDGNYAMSIAIKHNFLWMGMSSGALYRINLETKELKKFLFGNEDHVNAHINALHVSSDGSSVWASKKNGIGVYQISIEGKNQQYSVVHYGEDLGFTSAVTVLKENSQGDIYMGAQTDSAYLFQYHASTKSIRNISQPIAIECTESFEIFDMILSQDSLLLLGTSCGLWQVNTASGKFAERLYHNHHQSTYEWQVRAMALDKSKRLWLATKQGIVLYDPSEQILFDEAGGLASKTISYRGLMLDPDNQLWVATTKGVSMVDLGKMSLAPTPSPIITEVSLNEQKIFAEQKQDIVILGQSYLVVNYAPAVYPGEDVHYQTRIIGYDSAWSAFTANTYQMLRPLSPGKYTFQVRAQHLNGYYWSKPSSLEFSVEISWYKRWWAILLYAVLFFGVIFSAVRWNTWRLVRAKKKLAHAVRERMHESIEQNKMLSQQKEEIIKQSEYIQERNQQLESAQRLIESQNHQLTESNRLLEDKVKQRTKELKNALEELRKSHDELDFFIYRAAHDLRGPIARVSGLAGLLNQVSKDEMVQDCVGHLNTTADHMGQMLQRLLQTLEIKSTQPTWQTISLETLLQSLIEWFVQKNLITHQQVQYQNTPWVYVNTDGVLLTRLLGNLIQNSIDFQNPYQDFNLIFNTIEDGEKVVLYIEDTGKGILLDAQKHIFDLFYIGNENSTGAGLGLYEASIIAQKLKGKVLLHSSEPGKTIFEVVLPIG